MALFEMSSTAITSLIRVNFSDIGILEREDLQRLLRDNISVIAPDTLIISEEFSNWDRSDRRIDLLGVDRQARLVVIELKRTTDDSWADLQALRYASMVSQMTFDEAVETLREYLTLREQVGDARATLLDFFGWGDVVDGRFGDDVRIVLAAADFSPEVTSTVLFLNERDLDIRCVRIQPYRLGTSILLDVQQIIPLPEAAEFQIQIKQKQRQTRAVAEQSADWTRYDITANGQTKKGISKRDVIFAATMILLNRGESPQQLELAIGHRVFEAVDGNVDTATFEEALKRRRTGDPRVAKRYFTNEDQLFRTDNKTYAFTNQWTKAKMESALAALVNKYGDFGFSVAVAS